MKIVRTFLIAFALAGSVSSQAPMSVEQVLDLRHAGGPHFGKDFIAFSVSTPRPIADGPGGARRHVYVVDGLDAASRGEVTPRAIVAGDASASSAAVRPNARAITFLRSVDGVRQLHEVDIDAVDDVTVVADTPSIASYAWRPDGAAFAFTSVDERPAARARAHELGFEQVVVDEDWRHLSLWIWEAGKGARRLTQGTSVFGFRWSPDGTRIACACAPRNLVDDSYMFKRLRVLDVATGALESLVENPGKLGAFDWGADGASVAFISAADPNDPHAGMLYRVATETREVQPWTRGLLGMVQSVQRAADGGFLVNESVGVRTRLRRFGEDGAPVWQFEPKEPRLAITAADESPDGHIAFTASSRTHATELFFLPKGSKSPVRLTELNPSLRDAALGEQSVARFRARDGLPIEGLLIKPVGYEEGTRYPFVIVVHGGPEAHNSDGWLTRYSTWGQLLAARGYVSWYPNYRASTGYGVEFCKKDHGDPMGREFEDHLDAIDHFAAAGLIDPERVGIGGGSYGGYTAAWAATKHSERFAAAVSFVPFVDIRTKWMTSDIPWEFYYVHYQEKWPWEQPGLLSDRSPLQWAPSCDTPLLLLGGTSDPRVHPSQPFMLYRAVRFATDTPVRYVQYPGEGHGNRTNVYQYDYALRTLRWFDHYLAAPDRRDAEPPSIDLDYEIPE